MSREEQLLFLHKLVFLLRAETDLVEALIFVAEEGVKMSWTKEKILKVIKLIREGLPLATAFLEAGIFKDIFTIELVSAGEKSGQLIRCLEYVSKEIEKQRALRKQLISSLIYPVIIMFGTLAVSLGLIIFIFPKILPIFSSLNLKLPWTTQCLIFFVYLIEHQWLLVLLILVIGTGALWHFRKIIFARMLQFPPTAHLYQVFFNTQFCRIFSLLLYAGLSVPEALSCIQKMWRNSFVGETLVFVSHGLQEGRSLSAEFANHTKFFPRMLTGLIQAGEKSGNLAEALDYLSQYYEEELVTILKTLSVLIEPALMIFLGLGIGLISLSLITPIYSLTQHVNG